MTAKRLCIDIDNVLAQTDVLMRKLIKEHTRARVELRYEDIVTFDYRQCEDANGAKITNQEWANIHDFFPKKRIY